MLSKARIKLIRSLNQNKFRQAHRLFIAEGWKSVREVLAVDPARIHSLYTTQARWELIRDKVPGQADYELIDQKELKQISLLKTPVEMLALVRVEHPVWDSARTGETYSLVLDRIQDPGNMGSIIRIADWFGISTIICSKDCADLYNPKTIQASMGSFMRVQVFYRDLPELLSEFNEKTGFGVYGTFLEGSSIYNEKFGQKGFIVLGNESKGISENLVPLLSKKIMIPSHSSEGHPDSLNVAAAAAIICSELRRE